VAALIAVAILVFVYLAPENPQSLYLEAERSLDSHPEQAVELAQRAIVAAKGDFPDAHLLWCRALASQQRWDEALGCFASIREPHRCTLSELLPLADAASQAEQPMLEELALDAAHRRSREQVEVVQRLVRLKYANREYGDVLRLCKTWEELEPQNNEPLEATMSVHQRTAEFTKAAEVARRLLRRPLTNDKRKQIQLALVGLLVDLGQAEPARQEVERLLAEGDTSPELRLRQAQLLRLERRFEEALREIQQLPHDEATALRALQLRGTLYFDLGQFERAREDLSRVIEQQPNHKEAHYKLAQALLRLGKQDEAQKHLQISQQLTEAALQAVGAAPASQTPAGNE
jgi:tetratricopeptide (TPR) repeat protein